MDKSKVTAAVRNLIQVLVDNAVHDLHRDGDIADEVKEQCISLGPDDTMDPEALADEIINDPDINVLCKVMIRDILYMIRDVAKSD